MPRSGTSASAAARQRWQWRMCARCSTIIMQRLHPRKRCVMAKLGRDEGELHALGALWTAREIEQQPAMLRKTHAALVAGKGELDSFLRPLLDRAAMRVILAGAGTSAFIGECLAPYLAARLHRRVEAIPTTDLVSAPYLYLEKGTPTLLVSF